MYIEHSSSTHSADKVVGVDLNTYLTIYIKLVHEEAKSDCNQCAYRTIHQKYLTIHIKSVCEEVKSDFNQYDYKTT